MDFNPLRQSHDAVPSRFERILPDGAPSIQTIFDDAHAAFAGVQFVFHHAGPTFVECKPFSGKWDDAPGERISVNENVLHESDLISDVSRARTTDQVYSIRS